MEIGVNIEKKQVSCYLIIVLKRMRQKTIAVSEDAFEIVKDFQGGF